MDVKESTYDGDCSYDEVFFGRLTLKEVKKRIFMDVHQKNKISKLVSHKETELNNADLKLIEQSSQPDLHSENRIEEICTEHLKSTSDPLFDRIKHHTPLKSKSSPDNECQDSFLEMEKNVTKQCDPSSNCSSNNLDNTLEFVDFILNHAQCHVKQKIVEVAKHEGCGKDENNLTYDAAVKVEILSQSTSCDEEKPNKVYISDKKNILNSESTYKSTTPVKHVETLPKMINVKPEVEKTLNTPINKRNINSNLFKTPKIPLSSRKHASSKKTPSRLNTYEHVASPIAMYIRNCPQVPLVKDVHPKKPLPSTSLIPKLLKNASECKGGKENVDLPSLAYRSAKKTLVIDVNKEKLPQSHWAQKLTSMSQKPVVLKHNHREVGRKPLLMQQDSFQDLSLHQADVSICTQKLAFNKL